MNFRNENMYPSHHYFHIPVMGTGYSMDTAIRVGRFGISSVISLVDDMLCEQIRRYYAQLTGRPYTPIGRQTEDGRALRIEAYLNLVQDIVDEQMIQIRSLPFEAGNDKTKYFELLPDSSPLRQRYIRFLELPQGAERDREAAALSQEMRPGNMNVNIMTKLDRMPYGPDGQALGPEYTDAKAALRGFAKSRLEGNLVLSAGINPTLYGYIENFRDFYRNEEGVVRKGIILKVSDYRSAMTQGKFLAKKGIEVQEFRIESGLNCGGHAFATDGFLIGPILQEFKDHRDEFPSMFEPMIEKYFVKNSLPIHASARNRRILVTYQGGLGTVGENLRLMEYYGMDAVGWASPFLLVPEATAVDTRTRKILADAQEEDFYMSDASPLGVLFNNVRASTANAHIIEQAAKGSPGSVCPKNHLQFNTEFTERPVCLASKEYLQKKLPTMGSDTPPSFFEASPEVQKAYEKSCICHQLGNSIIQSLGITDKELPTDVCPGPNVAWFNRNFTLREMINHIYGRGRPLVSDERPHAFAKEMSMYVDHFEKLILALQKKEDAKERDYAQDFLKNVFEGLDYYRKMLVGSSYPYENLESLKDALEREGQRLTKLADSVQLAVPVTK